MNEQFLRDRQYQNDKEKDEQRFVSFMQNVQEGKVKPIKIKKK